LEKNGHIYLLAESLWSLFIKFSNLPAECAGELRSDYFAGTPFLGLYESAKKHYNDNNKTQLVKEAGELGVILSLRAEKDYSDYDESKAKGEATKLLFRLLSEWKKHKKSEFNELLKKAEIDKNFEEVQNIMRRIMDLDK